MKRWHIRMAPGWTVTLACMLWGASLVPAQEQDLILHETTTTTGMIGQQATTLASTNYFSQKAMRKSIEGVKDVIIRVDEGKIIDIDHRQKTYSIVDIGSLAKELEKATAEVAEDHKEQLEAIRKTMGGMMDACKVVKLGPGESVSGYRTEKYAVKGMMEMEVWAAPDLKVPAFYYDALKLNVRPNPIFDMRRLYDEFKKIDGMTLKSVMTLKLMDLEVRSETLVDSVKITVLPPSTFEVPAGYRQVEPNLLR